MALSFDVLTTSVASASTSYTFSHPATSTPGGAVVLIAQNSGITDEVVGVTYGGTAMGEIPGSPLVVSAGAEDGVLYGYILGSTAMPTGTQTVAINATSSGASTKNAICVTFNGPRGIYNVFSTTLDSAGTANPSVTMTTPADSLVVGVLHSGNNTVTSSMSGLSYTYGTKHDYGTQGTLFQRLTSVVTTSTSLTCDWVLGSEEAGILAVTVCERSGGTMERTADGRWVKC